jgi:hypothetical protein
MMKPNELLKVCDCCWNSLKTSGIQLLVGDGKTTCVVCGKSIKERKDEAMNENVPDYYCADCDTPLSAETEVVLGDNAYCPICADRIAEEATHTNRVTKPTWRELLTNAVTAPKPRYTLIPAKPLELVAQVLTLGAAKHGDRGYENRTDTAAELDAALRHIHAHLSGELLDSEFGTPHLAHAAARLLIALEILENA